MISLLLIASFAMATMGRSLVKQEETPDQAKEETLTPDEEREARALAEDFISRLEKSEDVTPLVKELFVNDFTERLRSNMKGLFPLVATPEVAAQMSSDEILRAYAASINCIYLASRLYIEFERKREQEKAQRGETADQDEVQQPMLSELIPPSIIKLIQSDPLLAALLEQAIREEKEESRSNQTASDIPNALTSEADRSMVSRDSESLEDFWPFTSIEQMRHYTSLTEQGVKLLREHIDSLPPQLRPSVTEFWSSSRVRSTDEEADENKETIKPRLDVLTDEFMGYSAGTRLICANVMMFHMDMVRTTDGRLKVLNIYLIMD